MARSDKVPFRREYTITTGGYLESSEGFFVGDIRSLHMDVKHGQASLLVEGRVGKTGDWETISKSKRVDHIEGIAIDAFEYIRVLVVPVFSEMVSIILFGYDTPPLPEVQIVEFGPVAGLMSKDSHCELVGIHNELKKLNQYMEIIVEDKV